MAASGRTVDCLRTSGPAGEEVQVPVGILRGAADGPTLALVAGCHGSEYDGIEAVKRLFVSVDPAQLSGRLIVIPCLNVPAFYGLAMHVNPVDGENPGRAVPGDEDGSHTDRMVELMWRHAIEPADYVIDVHGGDLEEELVEYSQVELTGDEAVDAAAEAMARVSDMPFLLRRPARPLSDERGPLPLVAGLHGKPSILLEAGSHGQLDEAAVESHLNGIRNVLNHLEMLPGEPTTRNAEPMELRRFVGVPAPVDGFWYPDVRKGDVISRGQHLGEIRDFFDEKLAEVRSPENAAILGVMTIPPRRKGSMLMGVGTFD